MRLYYSWLFPAAEMHRWLAYGHDAKAPAPAGAAPGAPAAPAPGADATFFQRREFCFTLEGDIFVRYQSFKDGEALAAALAARCPSKIDVGPVYTVDPARRGAYAAGAGFAPVERELVFDIDLTDYDDVRTCGSGGHICGRCWPLMAAAVAVLDRGLREDFGFKHVLFVYSGRRGVHCWVADARARALTDEQRAGVANYFAVYKGTERGGAKLATGLDDHPAVAAAHELLAEAFAERVLPEQRLLEDPAHMEAILQYIPSEPVREAARRAWAGARGGPGAISVARWEQLRAAVDEEREALVRAAGRGPGAADAARAAKGLAKGLRDVVCAYAYPRLDMEVSKKMNHLLKAPFCVHPKTGRVCVPIDPAAAWEFDPEAVPTVGQLLNQLPKGGGAAGEKWRATGMADAVGTFRRCFGDALAAESAAARAADGRAAAAKPTLAW
jgi:DNA primase small subunit